MKTKFSGILTLFLAFVVQLTFAQEKTISGTISDENGLPLPGVNIIVKGTTTGTQTDFDGNYSITANTGDVLTYSFLGYTTKEMTIGTANNISFAMEVDSEALEEVVITAFGIARKKDEITTAYQEVQSEELVQAQNPNVVQGLAGKVSGLQINTTNSGVNKSTNIRLRSLVTVSGNNSALVVIDGVITDLDLTDIDPNIIETVNVLKGANGAALYGQQASGGAVIVTTKKNIGDGDKFTINVNSAIDIETVAFVPDRQLRYGQGWNGVHTSYENGGWGPEFDGQIRPTGLPLEDGTYRYFPYSPIKDNIKEFFKDGVTTQNTVSISAGNLDNGYVFFSANRLDSEFVVENDKLRRNSFNFKAGKKVGKWTVEGNVSYINSRTEQTNGGLFLELLQTATNIPVEEFSAPNNATHWTSYYRSPYWIRDNERNDFRQDQFNGVINLGYEINDNIDIRYNGNMFTSSTDSQSWVNGYVDTLNVGGGDHTTQSSYGRRNTMTSNYYGDLIANFNYELTDDISLSANIGNNIQDRYFSSSQISGNNLTIDGFYNITNITGQADVNGFGNNGWSRRRSYALYGNLQLDFKDYLTLNVTGRNDWTSILSEDNNSFFYPSVGVSFIPTKAFDFGGDTLNYLKIAGNWVKVGNDGAFGAYSVNPVLAQTTGFPYGTINSFSQTTSITDPNLKPEFIESIEFNLSAGFFKDRITLDASYYTTKTTDLISNKAVSYASGVTQVRANIGELSSEGFEVDLGLRPIWSKESDGFRWQANFSYATNKSTVEELEGDAEQVAINAFTGNANPVGIYAIEGQEFPLIQGVGYSRDPQGRVIIDPTTGTPVQTPDLIVLGKTNPDYIIGLNTFMTFKGLRLAATFDYRTGHQFWSGGKSWLSWSGHLVESAQNGRTGFIFPNSAVETSPGSGEYVANTGVITGGTSYSSFLNYYSNDYYTNTENFVLDATAFKCRELALSYTLPSKLLENTMMKGITVGVQARNPFMILPKENRNYNDPETSQTTNIAGGGLAAIGQYPVTRTFGFKLNATF
ncbi:SusC/RagA family TonB-linked outer membrane protein [Hanstruepera neustonica]|uniref:SusC/RagA family TonB-linked outer membrane protein n=1 Tax=Hanstruepera neustonica TaxID=1445657 RepID=A0A2K1E511_9FLAO|nr:SusC/RagA family TonB-linked outer membrane protein [Hanstruepera neustonica]PNQ75375.1 SusC/RagA family TonB-linked outer membrane protein [Hanstruepera neustonica]